MKILLVFLLGFTSLVADAQSMQPWTLSYSTTEDLKQIFALGPKDSMPDTMFTQKKNIIIYDVAGEKINFITKSGTVMETNLEGEVLYASKEGFVYYFKDEEEKATDGKKILTTEEIKKYMIPLILEVEHIE
ncbi:MAG: hypothetical protein KBD26_00485 [Candidatus Pacebacteria bacterium]|nr:hypothetical protein [Candidatus Paceibacterota bacterium]MBP9772287.1 hypothetical protein [Candidatus Paceibacterota bacterium]